MAPFAARREPIGMSGSSVSSRDRHVMEAVAVAAVANGSGWRRMRGSDMTLGAKRQDGR